MSTLSTQQQYATIQKQADYAMTQLAVIKKEIEQPKRLEAARRMVIQKTYFSTAQAAAKVGMPVTSFKRFVEKFALRHSATLDGLPCYSPDWIKAFNSNLNALEIGHESFTCLGRKEGKALIERGQKEINHFSVPKTVGGVGGVTKQKTAGDSCITINGQKLTAKSLEDGSRAYYDEKGRMVTKSTPAMKADTSRIDAFKDANLARQAEAETRRAKEQTERTVKTLRRLKGLD